MSKSINGAILGLVLFLWAYCVCFWFGVMPKYYPVLGEVHIRPPSDSAIAVKFVGAALVGILVGAVGFLVGRKLPARSSAVLHALLWATLIAASIYLVGRETAEYILGMG